MAYIKVDNKKVNKKIAQDLIKICPFNAFVYEDGILRINENCRLCMLCVKKGAPGVCTFVDQTQKKTINKEEFKGILVYIEHHNKEIHPVSLELIGKALSLAKVRNEGVFAVVIGKNVSQMGKELLTYGVDKVFLYDDPKFSSFDVISYTNVLEDLYKQEKFNVLLVGATALGRSFAPRVAARLKTGMTADCTRLDITEKGDLLQIRPAFGGSVMAKIKTDNHRPQMATVRYKMFDKPEQVLPKGVLIKKATNHFKVSDLVELIKRIDHPKAKDISESEVLICVGRAFKKESDLSLIKLLQKKLNADVACTRPLIENGWFHPRFQVGLSGRTVKPKLLINIGISGAVHFLEGIKDADVIISINNNPDAKIFSVSHYGIVGDLYEILPKLNELLKGDYNV